MQNLQTFPQFSAVIQDEFSNVDFVLSQFYLQITMFWAHIGT